MTDEMLSMIKSGTDVTITPSEGAKIVRGADGKITSIDFEPVSNEKNTNQYTIIYYTEAEQTWKDQTVRNTVTFKPDGGDDVSGTGDVSIKGRWKNRRDKMDCITGYSGWKAAKDNDC